MAKKKTLKKKTQSKSSVSKVTAPVVDSARDIWLAGLGALSVAQQEGGKVFEQGNKLFEKLVAEGSKLEKDTRKAAEAGVSDIRGRFTGVGKDVEGRVDEVRQQAQDNWDKLEKVFEDRVARVLGRMGVPTAEEVRELTARVEELNKKIDAQRKSASASKATSKKKTTRKKATRKKAATRKASAKTASTSKSEASGASAS